mmetsp:Transcript_21861/g.45542  ORF Transcript_21861/g.45542 Transcript_21861/m.45542 type:complete len:127 (+) Transcript_21861:44-424(+)
MSFDPRADADSYLKSNKVMELFHDLGTKILYSKPDDPNAFLMEKLKEIQECKNRGAKSVFFTDNDITTMYRMFDVTGSGWITREQYGTALECLGVGEPTVEVEGDKVGREVAMKNFKEEVEKLSLT